MESNIFNLEDLIRAEITKTSNTKVRFEYGISNGNEETLNVVTFNPRNGETFLACTVVGMTKESALEHALSALKNSEKANTYKVEWIKKGTGGNIQISHFVADDIQMVLDKFYYAKEGKLKSEYEILGINVMPIS